MGAVTGKVLPVCDWSGDNGAFCAGGLLLSPGAAGRISCGSGSAAIPTLGVRSEEMEMEMGTVCCDGDAYIGGGESPCAACPASRRLSIAKRLHSFRIRIWIEIYICRD
jgi:hypothetical protein